MMKFLRSCFLCFLWLVLTAQSRFEVSSFTPKSQQIDPSPEMMMATGTIITFFLILIAYRSKLKKKFDEKLRHNYNLQYAGRQLKLLTGEGPDSAKHLKLLHDVLGTKDPIKIMKFSRSLILFDKRTQEYLISENQTIEAQRSVTKSRQLLNLTINNYNIAFKSTKLLPIGQKLRCKVSLKSINTFSNYYNGDRKIEFNSVVLGQSESKIFIETPKDGDRPVEMKGIIEVECELERFTEATSDELYEFKLPFLTQKQGKTKNVLILSHTQDIERIKNEEIDDFDFSKDWHLA